jgi:hypothetical protein
MGMTVVKGATNAGTTGTMTASTGGVVGISGKTVAMMVATMGGADDALLAEP